MSTPQINIPETAQLKEVHIADVVYLLKHGYTRWTRDLQTTGAWGSIQAHYGLTNAECEELFSHEKLRKIKTRIPTLRIIDDAETISSAEEEEPAEGPLDQDIPVIEATPVATPVEQATPLQAETPSGQPAEESTVDLDPVEDPLAALSEQEAITETYIEPAATEQEEPASPAEPIVAEQPAEEEIFG